MKNTDQIQVYHGLIKPAAEYGLVQFQPQKEKKAIFQLQNLSSTAQGNLNNHILTKKPREQTIQSQTKPIVPRKRKRSVGELYQHLEWNQEKINRESTIQVMVKYRTGQVTGGNKWRSPPGSKKVEKPSTVQRIPNRQAPVDILKQG